MGLAVLISVRLLLLCFGILLSGSAYLHVCKAVWLIACTVVFKRHGSGIVRL